MSTPSSPQYSGGLPNQMTFPLETMTDHQRRYLTQYLEAKYRTVNVEEPVSFVRLLIRDKPGMVLTPLVMPSNIDYSPEITIQELVEAFNLNYHVCGNDDLYVSRTSWRLDLISIDDIESDNIHYRMGVFLGYSKSDINHYFTSDNSDTRSDKLVHDGIFQPEEIAYTKFLPQRFDDSIEGYKRAIQRGKNIYDAVKKFSEDYNHSPLATYVDQLYDMACDDYIP